LRFAKERAMALSRRDPIAKRSFRNLRPDRLERSEQKRIGIVKLAPVWTNWNPSRVSPPATSATAAKRMLPQHAGTNGEAVSMVLVRRAASITLGGNTVLPR
jgi:hypothetical protein